MAVNLDRHQLYRRDTNHVAESLGQFDQQLADGWRQVKGFRLPATFTRPSSIVICGMGGSHLAADILISVFGPTFKIPIVVHSDYGLPGWVNRQTVVICASYSGSTAETLSAFRAAKKIGAPVITISAGGPLASLAAKAGAPYIAFSPTFNPSGQPRLGLGYGLAAQLAVWRKLRLLSIADSDVDQLVTMARAAIRRYGPTTAIAKNQAKKTAKFFYGGVPILIGSEWAIGNLHTFANQIHENAKTWAAWYPLPELNHHLLEGLRNRSIGRLLRAWWIRDMTINPANARRAILTKNILSDLGIRTLDYRPHGRNAIAKAIDLVVFSGFTSWYLALLRKVNPAAIPTVNALKAELAKR